MIYRLWLLLANVACAANTLYHRLRALLVNPVAFALFALAIGWHTAPVAVRVVAVLGTVYLFGTGRALRMIERRHQAELAVTMSLQRAAYDVELATARARYEEARTRRYGLAIEHAAKLRAALYGQLP